jgi:hypothetical protein
MVLVLGLALTALCAAWLSWRSPRRWSTFERVDGDHQPGVPGGGTAPFSRHEAANSGPGHSRRAGTPSSALFAVAPPNGEHHAASTAQASTLSESTLLQARQVRWMLAPPPRRCRCPFLPFFFVRHPLFCSRCRASPVHRTAMAQRISRP